MAYENLKNAIKQAIKQNGNQEITGSIMQSTLLSMADSIYEIAQESGDAEDKVMSQKATSAELNKKANTADINSKFTEEKKYVDTKFTEEKKRVDAELAKKFDKASIVQKSGDDENSVMSQKATVAAIAEETTRAKAAEQANTTAIEAAVSKNRELEEKQGIYNVDVNAPLSSGQFYTSTTAHSAIPTPIRKLGLIITYKTNATTSTTEQFIGSSISNWETDSNWKNIGSDGGGGTKILEWNTDVATTRKQVKMPNRKKGLIISYVNESLDNGIFYSEQYLGSSYTDTEWVKDNNWEQVFTISNNANDQSPLLFAISDDSRIVSTDGRFGQVEFVNVGLLVNKKVIVLNGKYSLTGLPTEGLYLPLYLKSSLLQNIKSIDLSNYLDVSTISKTSKNNGLCICTKIGTTPDNSRILWKSKILNYEDSNYPELISGGIIMDSYNTTIEGITYIRIEVLEDTVLLKYPQAKYKIKSGIYLYKKNATLQEQFYCYIDMSNQSSEYELKFKHGLLISGSQPAQDALPQSNIFRPNELPVATIKATNAYSSRDIVYPIQTLSNFKFYRKRVNNNATWNNSLGVPQKDYNINNTALTNILDLGGAADANYHVYDYESEDKTSDKYGKAVGWYKDKECTIPATNNALIFAIYSCPIYIPKGNFLVNNGSGYVPNCRMIVGDGETSCLCGTEIDVANNDASRTVIYDNVKLINNFNILPFNGANKVILKDCHLEWHRKNSYSYCFVFYKNAQVTIKNCNFYAKNQIYSVFYFNSGSENCLVDNCSIKLDGGCSHVIRFNGKMDNINIVNNVIHAPKAITGIFIGCNREGTAKNVSIKNNKIFGVTEESISFDGFGNNTGLMPPMARGAIIEKVNLPSNQYDTTGEKFKRVGFKIDEWKKWGKTGDGQFDWGFIAMTDEEINAIVFKNYIWYITNGKSKGLNGEIVGYDKENKVIETNIFDYNDDIKTDGTIFLEVMSGGFNITISDNYIRGNYGVQETGNFVWTTGVGVCVYMGVINALVSNNRIEGLPKGVWVFNSSGQNGVPIYTSNTRILNNYIECSRIAGISIYSGTEYDMNCNSHAILFNKLVNCNALHIENQERLEFKGNLIINTPIVAKNSCKLENLPEPNQGLSGQEFQVFEYSENGTFETISNYVCKKNGDTYEHVKIW